MPSPVLLAVTVALGLGVILATFGGPFQVPVLADDSDEALHTYYAHKITHWGEALTGSLLLGRGLAWSAGYGKEALDVFVGKPWSEADLAADAVGIEQAR